MIGLIFCENCFSYHSAVSTSKEQNWWSKFNTRLHQRKPFLKETSEWSQSSPWTNHDDRYLGIRRKLGVWLPHKYRRWGTVFTLLIRHSTLSLQYKSSHVSIKYSTNSKKSTLVFFLPSSKWSTLPCESSLLASSHRQVHMWRGFLFHQSYAK